MLFSAQRFGSIGHYITLCRLNLAGNEILFFVKVAFCEKKNVCTRI